MSGSVVVTLSVVRLVAIKKHPRYVAGGGQVQVIYDHSILRLAIRIDSDSSADSSNFIPSSAALAAAASAALIEWPFAPNTAAIPRNLDVENTLMRRTEGFDYCVTRSRASFSLQALLKHGFIVRLRGGKRISAFQLIPQRITNKTSRRFKSPVQKYRAGDRFKHVRQQSIFMSTAALLFTASEAQKLAEV